MSTTDESTENKPTQPGASPIVAYVLPFALFMLFGAAEGWEPLKAYYPLVYTAKITVVVGVWCYFRRRYPAPSGAGLDRTLEVEPGTTRRRSSAGLALFRRSHRL